MSIEVNKRNGNPFRILSIDGGGVRGYLSARILQQVENYLNQKYGENKGIGQRFDLITGTSTGAIVGVGLALGKTAAYIAEFYQRSIPVIFSKKNQRGYFRSKWQPRYNSRPLQQALEECFGPLTLKDVQTDVCVTAVSLRTAKPRFYKSGYRKLHEARLDESVVDVCMATSAPPTYFKAHSSLHSKDLIDGGICANNPSMVALVEAFQFERPSKRGVDAASGLEDVVLLSIGSGEQPSLPYAMEKLRNGGELNWARPISDLLMESQSELIHQQCKFLLSERYLRINPPLKFPMQLDDASKIDDLKNMWDLTHEIQKFLDSHF